MSSSPDPYLTPPRKTYRSNDFSDDSSTIIASGSSSNSTISANTTASSSSSLGKRPIKGTNSMETVSYGSPIGKGKPAMEESQKEREIRSGERMTKDMKDKGKAMMDERKLEVDDVKDKIEEMQIDPPKRLKFTPNAEIKNARPRRNR